MKEPRLTPAQKAVIKQIQKNVRGRALSHASYKALIDAGLIEQIPLEKMRSLSQSPYRLTAKGRKLAD